MEMEISEPKNFDYSKMASQWHEHPEDVWNESENVQQFLQQQEEDDDIPFQLNDLFSDDADSDAGPADQTQESSESYQGTETKPKSSPAAFQVFVAKDLEGDSEGKAGAAMTQAKAANLQSGQLVFHPTYGKGVVAKVSGAGKKQLAEIEFDSVGVKKIKPAYSNLVTLG